MRRPASRLFYHAPKGLSRWNCRGGRQNREAFESFTLPTTNCRRKSLDACIWRTLRSPLFANNLEGPELRDPSGGLRVSRLSREWRNGRRAGLRIRCRKAWGFKSPLSQFNKMWLARVRNACSGRVNGAPATELGRNLAYGAPFNARSPGTNDQERFGSLSASRSLIHCSIDS